MRVIYNSAALFSRHFLRSDTNGTLMPKYFTKLVSSRQNAQLDYLKSVIESNDSNWQAIKNTILNKQGQITEKNIDAIILKFVIGQKKYDCAYSFANYLQASGTELNLGATNNLLNLYIEHSKIQKPSEKERQFILDSYKHLYEKYNILDYFTSEKLLQALCVINEWELSLKILDDIHLSSTPSHNIYSTLIGTLFKNNQKSKALTVIQQSLSYKRPLQDYAYEEWLTYILREYRDQNSKERNLEEFCLYLAHNYVKVSEKTAERITETFLSLGWSVDYTSVKRASGHCVSCRLKLNNIEISDEEFLLLQQNVKDKLIVGSDLFLKTSPLELEQFLKFIDRTKPYDIVLDGLNIAYAVGKGSNNEKLKALSMVVDYFLKQNKKILLLGRKHMFKWHAPTLKELCSKTCSFFTDNISQDDPYFITAAILSGPNTDFVTRDFLRGHRFLMKNDQLKLLFQRWQWKHQWMSLSTKRKPMLQVPLKFTPCAQKFDLGWHIPYEKVAEDEENQADSLSATWLCIRKNVDS